jgi:hypothetical protein
MRREFRPAWLLLGVSGALVLWPALRLPDGIPSPAADLARNAPWAEGAGDFRGNPQLGDVTHQIQPWLLYLREELRSGRLPFWNPHQFSGYPYWGNGQSAPLFPLHLLFALLPLKLGFVLLPWIRFMIAGAGVWALAGELGLRGPGRVLAAVVYPLSGMLISFLLYSMGNTLALVPWVMCATERLATGRGTWRLLAVTGGLELLGGFPETVVHTGLLAALYLLIRGAGRATWGAFLGGWVAAGALSAPQLLPFAFTVIESGRWAETGAGAPIALSLVLPQPLRLILPQLYGHPANGTWWGPFNYSATAVYVGAASLVLAAAGIGRLRGDRRWLAVATLLAFSVLTAYHLPGPYDLLSRLPLLDRVAHHRLILGVELSLALLAGAGLERWRLGAGERGMLMGGALVAGMTGLCWMLFARDWLARGRTGEQMAWSALALGVAVLSSSSLLLDPWRRQTLAPFVLLLTVADLLAAHGGIIPGLPLQRLYPATGATAFLKGQAGRVGGVEGALYPNAAMVYGLYDVRGDDPMKLARYERMYGTLAEGDSVYFRPIRKWDDPWLDRLGVRWVVAGPEAGSRAGWREAYRGPDARVFERPLAMPVVRWESGEALPAATQAPGRWDLSWDTPRSERVVVAETWDPGWSASLDGRPAPIERADELIMAVRVAPANRRLTLTYRPPGLIAGFALGAGAAVVLLVSAAVRRRRRRPQTRSESPIVT